ncbi:MAG: (d)CMP kinase [Breznakia sp.]
MAINIAIDGPSASGKSTIAKALAKELHYKYLDTGAMYRCCAYFAKINNINIDNEKDVENMLLKLHIDFSLEGKVLMNGKDVSTLIRTNEISMLTSKLSQLQIVRMYLVKLQQTITANKSYIVDGRDIGTVVLPHAEIKIFLIADVKERAERRFQEALQKGEEVSFDVICKDIEARDKADRGRLLSPLKKAKDAIEIDSSKLTIDEVKRNILDVIKTKEVL